MCCSCERLGFQDNCLHVLFLQTYGGVCTCLQSSLCECSDIAKHYIRSTICIEGVYKELLEMPYICSVAGTPVLCSVFQVLAKSVQEN